MELHLHLGKNNKKQKLHFKWSFFVINETVTELTSIHNCDKIHVSKI